MKIKIKRILVLIVLVIISFLLQTSVLKHIAIGSITPNLFIILVSSFGFMRGKKEGMLIGFFLGLLIDIFYGVGNLIGFYALVYLVIGYLNGFFKRRFLADDIKLPVALIFGSEFSYGLVNYLFLYMMRSKFQFIYYFGQIIMPELVYTILVTLIFYPIILRINQFLEADEKRSAGKFV